MAFAKKTPIVLSSIFLFLGLLLLIIGVAVYHSRPDCEEGDDEEVDGCQPSAEAKRSGFLNFLEKVHRKYYKLHPNQYIQLLVTSEVFLQNFKPYDPSPKNIKFITDEGLALVAELDNLPVNIDRLNGRERKAYAQIRHFCKHNFGQPYDVNYYAGDWLMGPNFFCWQPICALSLEIYYSLLHLQPLNYDDVELIKNNLMMFKKTLEQYTENIRTGWKVGMVRSVEDCEAALSSFAQDHHNVSYYNETGVLMQWYIQPVKDPEYFGHLFNQTSGWIKWREEHGEYVNDTVLSYIVEYIGKPLNNFIRFLETENMRHCVPSSLVSGLGSLPVDYVYLDGVQTSERTTKKLPTGEPIIGKESYSKILSFFTTNEMTPQEIHELGYQQLNILYPQVVDIARSYTKENDNSTAINRFRERIEGPENFFAVDLPEIESNKTAHRLCASEVGAKEHCPKRWAAMQRWFNMAMQVMSVMDSKISQFFHLTGQDQTTPSCPVRMNANFNPSSGAQSYLRSFKGCGRAAHYNIPFFLLKPGPIYEEYSVNAHEARPGHHTQVQGLIEHFGDTCGGVIGWLDKKSRYTAFSEGWALYAENPLIAQDTDVYEDESMRLYKYGMLKWQVWRALRLIVDTGLHFYGYNRDWALKMFADYAWDEGDTARKEVTRYQSDPGQATAYMIGQLHILKLRKRAQDKLGKKFSFKDFHYQLLSQGSAPLSYLESRIDKWLSCLEDGKQDGCDTILGSAETEQKEEEDDRRYIIRSDYGAENPLPKPPDLHYV